MAVPSRRLTPLPDAVGATIAAALPLAGLTALRLLRAAGPVAGRRVLLTGASGGVGHFVTELAAGGGAELTAISASRPRAERLLALGAAQIAHTVADARGPFDIVLESVGGDSLAQAFAQTRKGGTIVWFGQAGRAAATLDFFADFEQTGTTIRHFHYEDSEIPIERDLATLVRLVARGHLHPEIGAVADWAGTAAMLRDLRARRIRGKAVLQITDSKEPSHA